MTINLNKDSKVKQRKIKELKLSNKLLKKDIDSIKKDILKLEAMKANKDFEAQSLIELEKANEALSKDVVTLGDYCSKLAKELV